MFIITNQSRYLICSLVFIVIAHFSAYAQLDKIAPNTFFENPNNATVNWLPDGSVEVIGGPVYFTSGLKIAPASADPSQQINASEMILVNQRVYGKDQKENSNIVYGINALNVNLSSTSVNKAKVEVFRRPSIDANNPGSFSNQFGYDVYNKTASGQTDYLVYGTELDKTNTQVNWPILSYRDNIWRPFKKAKVYSNNYKKLWNRPQSKSIFWSLLAYLGVAFVVAAIVYVGTAEAFIAFVQALGTQIAYGLSAVTDTVVGLAFVISVAVPAAGLVFVGGYTIYLLTLVTQYPDLHDKGIYPQIEYTTNLEVPIPPKVNKAGQDAKKYNHEIDELSILAFDCSFDPSFKCYYEPLVDVFVRMEISNKRVYSVNIPGVLNGDLTLYQLFKDFYYEIEKYAKIDFKPLTVSSFEGIEATDKFPALGQLPNVDRELPKTIIVSNLDNQKAKLEFVSHEGFPFFYLIAKEVPLGAYGAYITDLGVYGTIGSDTYNLYRLSAHPNSDINPTIELTFNTDGPFLGGDNVVIANPIQHGDVVINNDDDQALFQNDLGDVLEDAELTVNGDVIIHEVDELNSSHTIIFSDSYQMFVGSKPNGILDQDGNEERMKGIVTENFVLLDKANFLLPDFVFEPHYKKRSLYELEEFIKINKHLPNVPSQKEVDDKGYYSVPEMMMGQLQQLEELYLHAFEQESKLEQIRNDKQKLKIRLQDINQRIQQLKKNNNHE